ncbi:MAG: tRNA preQ1(34) S-adenosylmethionine ribosyltransferase-isomerase QueA [Alphaproteobacteria bacterium]|nr:tRNA preQ1(34) S-adenosylmethionine ribosyltransferase-isomerase QueA [Alphaproteobacteria bacterium]
MDVAQFDFELPDELIAVRPAAPRDAARLLVVREDGALEHALVRDLPRYLGSGDCLVVNDTQVIKARLRGRRLRGEAEDGPRIEVLLHKREGEDRFLAFTRPARKLNPGDRIAFNSELSAEVLSRGEGGEAELGFSVSGALLDAAIARAGEIPLPPYIAGKRAVDARDEADYQTMFAREPGSVAAPTAGLHFTPELLEELARGGVGTERLTLHVGAGTFLPVTASDTAHHHMHAERAVLSSEVAQRLNRVHAARGRIVSVGTTSLRTLESAVTQSGQIEPFDSETRLFITPGFQFRAADMLLTNFHLPRSTLFMLVCAFAGTDIMKRAYAEAVREKYRFYSYGDACLLYRRQGS